MFGFNEIQLDSASSGYSAYVPSYYLAKEIEEAMNKHAESDITTFKVDYIEENNTMLISAVDGYKINMTPTDILRISEIYNVVKRCGFQILESIEFNPELLSDVVKYYCISFHCDCHELDSYYMVNNVIDSIHISDPEWAVWVIRLLQKHIANLLKKELVWVHNDREYSVSICPGDYTIRMTREGFIKFLVLLKESSKYMDLEDISEIALRSDIAYFYWMMCMSLDNEVLEKEAETVLHRVIIWDTNKLCDFILNKLKNDGSF